jgi:3-phenylpropionate/trans-cinnamate dioxygenase ferredoxin reductase subunit
VDSEAPILIVGAGQAGVQIAESLRQEGYEGELQLLGTEIHAPYQRPPLSKKWLLDPSNRSMLALRGEDALARRRITLRPQVTVERIDRNTRTAHLAGGETIGYSGLALATGSIARVLPLPGATLGHVLTLRSIEDASAIGDAIRYCVAEQLPLVVIGGGFIGLEVAASARKLGAGVTVLEGLPRLMSRVTAPVISDAFDQLHRSHGVKLVYGAQVKELVGDSRVRAVRTSNGDEYPAGAVIVGVGVRPDDRLAADAGVACDHGIIVDACARTSDPLIVAAGDCTARRFDDGRLVRLESVQNAVEQGKSAAAWLMGKERPFVATPWFWSDQYDVKLQMVGLSHGYEQVITRGDLSKPAFSAFYFHDGRLVAVDSVNRVQDHMAARRVLDAGVVCTPDQVNDPQFDLQALAKQTRPATTAAGGA